MSGPPCKPGKTAELITFSCWAFASISPPRGPRGGMILCQAKWAKDLDKLLFPGVQGGPLMHVIAAKAVALKEALLPEFKTYQAQILKNAQALAATLKDEGWRLVSGGTDNHLMLVDVFARGITGKVAEAALDRAGITVNKNTIPFDTNSPMVASGIRIGTPALTTRGMREKEMETIGRWLSRALNNIENEGELQAVRREVEAFCEDFPLYPARLAAYERVQAEHSQPSSAR
jgi:glycine hydroxymethyltransferase